MKILKRILIGIIALVAIILLIAALMKKELSVSRSVIINKPKQEVFDYVKYVKNQDNFSVWNMRDPNMIKTYNGTDGTVGFVYGWDSKDKNVGKGEQEIKKIADGQRIDFQLRFKLPFEANDDAFMTTEDAGPNQTKVTWGFAGKMPWPMNIMSGMMENQLGGDLQKGLENLKGVVEKP